MARAPSRRTKQARRACARSEELALARTYVSVFKDRAGTRPARVVFHRGPCCSQSLPRLWRTLGCRLSLPLSRSRQGVVPIPPRKGARRGFSSGVKGRRTLVVRRAL